MRNKSHIRELKLPRAPRKGLINIAAAPNNQVLIVRPTGASLHDISLSCTQEATILSSWKIPGTTDFAALVDDAATLLIAFNEYSEERPRRIGVRSFNFFFLHPLRTVFLTIDRPDRQNQSAGSSFIPD
jgi:hypothetical protein